MSKVLIIYHRIDFDGICSLAIAKRSLSGTGMAVDILGWTYGDEIPSGEYLRKYGKIYLLDLSFPPEVMIRLRKTGKLVWVDHHITSVDDAGEHGYRDLPGIREIGKGACELCWKYFYPGSRVPKVVRYLSAYDVWDKSRFDWENTVLPFQYGMRNRYNIDTAAFLNDFSCFLSPGGIGKAILDEGRAIVNYCRVIGKRACKAYGFEISIDNGRAKGLCLLTPHFGSLEMEETVREHGCDFAVCVNRMDENRYKVSLYMGMVETDFNAGEYLKERYGGGGHKGAAGAVLDKRQFEVLIKDCIL